MELLYNTLNLQSGDMGVDYKQVLLIITKKIKDEDKELKLTDAFKLIDKADDRNIKSEEFKDLLMSMGTWASRKEKEELADALIKEGDPKGTGTFEYYNFVKKILKQKGGKKGKKKKKKKKR